MFVCPWSDTSCRAMWYFHVKRNWQGQMCYGWPDTIKPSTVLFWQSCGTLLLIIITSNPKPCRGIRQQAQNCRKTAINSKSCIVTSTRVRWRQRRRDYDGDDDDLVAFWSLRVLNILDKILTWCGLKPGLCLIIRSVAATAAVHVRNTRVRRAGRERAWNS